MSGPVWEIALAILPALITAAITGLGFLLDERRKDKGAIRQRSSVISEESARVQYLRSWLETYNLMPKSATGETEEARDAVGADLRASHARLSNALERSSSDEHPSLGRRVLQRALLVPLRRPFARATRWGYWLFLFMGVVFSLAFMTSGYQTSNGIPASPLTVFASTSVMFAMFFGVAMLFRGWSAWLERRYISRFNGKWPLGTEIQIRYPYIVPSQGPSGAPAPPYPRS